MFIFKPKQPSLTPREFPLLLRYEWRVDHPAKVARQRAIDAMAARRLSGRKTPRSPAMIDVARVGRRLALRSRVTEADVDHVAARAG